jgi:hypothetical protein
MDVDNILNELETTFVKYKNNQNKKEIIKNLIEER